MLCTLIVIRQCLLRFFNRQLKKHTTIWERVNILMNIEFDSEPVYGNNDKYITAKIKSYGDKVNTNFQSKKKPKENVS